MSKERKSPYRAQFDGHRRLAAAVILQAIKDCDGASTEQDRDNAALFLRGDMWPFAEVLDLPADGRALQIYLKGVDLTLTSEN